MPVHPRNQPRPGNDVLHRTGETITPIGQAVLLLQHPVRRWALSHLHQHGQVTTHDITREFPYMDGASRATTALRPLLHFGVCNVSERQRGTHTPHTYTVNDLAVFRELRDYLNTLLEEPTHD